MQALRVATSVSRSAKQVRLYSDGPIEVQVKGNIKWYNTSKGYGFITRAEGAEDNKDVFFLYRDLPVGLDEHNVENVPVSFDVAEGMKGPVAINITVETVEE